MRTCLSIKQRPSLIWNFLATTMAAGELPASLDCIRHKEILYLVCKNFWTPTKSLLRDAEGRARKEDQGIEEIT